ncbi:MOSC domain-containing protein [Spirosoma terrae]|uniref:MOSC domain-containing protein n=1 Tax=Spirosoma terrae TaxID=1968276 RepID=UPI001BB000D6
MITILGLYIYPIKSLSGIAVSEAVVEPKGLRYDRRFMLVTPDGQFITQRATPQMALLDVAIDGTTLRVWHRYQPNDTLELPLTVPESDGDYETIAVDIWDSHGVPAITFSAEADQWFSQVLDMPCRLVYMPDATYREVDAKYARNNDAVSFADGYPYLLIGQASLDELNRRVSSTDDESVKPLEMRRFRPNIVVEGSRPYEEDSWQQFNINNIDFYGVKPCARCVLTTIDPETAQKGKEPLRTLATYRTWNKKILFGQNVLGASTDQAVLGTISVGQSIEIVNRQEPWLAPPEFAD